MDQELVRKIENTYFRFHRRRKQVVPDTDRETNLRWHSMERLLDEVGTPEFYDTVEIDGKATIFLVIDGATHLLQTSESEATLTSLGSLSGGKYVERMSISEGDDYVLEGTFTHPQLPGELTVRADYWNDLDRIKEARMLFRRWVSVPQPAAIT